MTIKYKCLYEITGRIEDVSTFLVPLRELPKEPETQHWSDCAVHSEPAYPKGECDCGGYKPEQEPVAWGNFKEDGTLVGLSQHQEDQANWVGRKPLYTTPPQRKPLTDEQIKDMYNEPRSDAEMLEFARAIEAAHGIKE